MRKTSWITIAMVILTFLAASCTPSATPITEPTSPPEPTTAPKPTTAPEPTTPPEPTAVPVPEEVVIGVIWPLTGSAAAMGVELQEGLELALDIINGEYDIDMPFAREAGLPDMGGAKIRVIYGDHQGDAEIGRAEAERLITEEEVDAIIGAFYSGVTAVVGQVCERYEVPLLNEGSSSPSLTRMGFQWFSRIILDDELRGETAQKFLDEVDAKFGLETNTVGLLYENTLFGTDVGRYQAGWAVKYGREIVATIPFEQNNPEFTSEIQRLIAANPDVVVSAAVGDAVTIVRSAKEMDFNPQLILGASGGWNSTYFLETLGKDADYVITMGIWAPDLAQGNKPFVGQVAELFREKYGHNMVERHAVAFNAMMVMADALNRAGTTEHFALQEAIRSTDIPGDQLILPWQGIRFNAVGQNELAGTIMLQVFDGQYYTVWPFDAATRDVVYPVPIWSER